VTLTPAVVKAFLTPDQLKLYTLIWNRFVASFMTAAVFDTVRVDIVAKQYVFRATGSNLKFPGFYAVWPRDEDERMLPVMVVNEVLDLHKLDPEQHFTQPPPRFTEASLIKELEEQGIGRPSTYVPIISTIQDRGYVGQEQRRFVPTWLGETVNEVMNKHFPNIVDISFTADMEHKLDDVEEGRRSWIEFLHGFYDEFKSTMEKAEAEMQRVQKPLEEIDEVCPQCGRKLVIRTGRFGRFISCSGFPECNYRRSFVNKTGALCPQCGGDLVERKTKQKNRVFYGCSNYPTCNFAIWDKPVPDLCPNCGGLMVIPKSGKVPVCYAEVITVQRSAEEKPQQDGSGKTTRPARAASSSVRTATRTTRRTTGSTTKKKATTRTSTAKATTAKASPAKTTASRTAAPKTTTSKASTSATKTGTTKAATKTTASKTSAHAVKAQLPVVEVGNEPVVTNGTTKKASPKKKSS